MARCIALLKTKPIGYPEQQQKMKQLLVPWNNFPFMFSLCDLSSFFFFFFPAGSEMLNLLPLKPMSVFPLNAADPGWVEFCC